MGRGCDRELLVIVTAFRNNYSNMSAPIVPAGQTFLKLFQTFAKKAFKLDAIGGKSIANYCSVPGGCMDLFFQQ